MPVQSSEARRLTGAGPILDRPGAAMDAWPPGPPLDVASRAWCARAQSLMDSLGWPGAPACRRLSGGATLGVPAPSDVLYTACELVDSAWADSLAGLHGREAVPVERRAAELAKLAAAEARPDLLALEAAAAGRGLTFLRGEGFVSLGLGAGSRTWPEDEMPPDEEVPWPDLHDVPVGLVTGTNGKTTVVRMLSTILKSAGHTVAATSTDFVAVGEETLDRGDCTGPQSARLALRHPSVTAAALEVARGGMLRRGLAVPGASAAAVTNVAADHLGEYGINTVSELADVKFSVHQALGPGGLLVTSAEDALCTSRAASLAPSLAARGAGVALTALTPDHPALRDHAGAAASVVDGHLAIRARSASAGHAGPWEAIVEVASLPATFEGRASYNVRNALMAAMIARTMGVDDEYIRTGLLAFRGDARDNPGRGNLFGLDNGARALVDFAHNAHGMDALGALAWSMPARRRLVMLSQPGDRRDVEIAAYARAAARLGADRYVVADLPGYLRGREPDEVPAVIRRALGEAGVASDRIDTASDPAAGVATALEWAGPDDLLVMALLSHRTQAFSMLATRAARP